jgi:hypothetical protein
MPVPLFKVHQELDHAVDRCGEAEKETAEAKGR